MQAPEGMDCLLTGKPASPARLDQAGSEYSLFPLVTPSKAYLLLALPQARFVKGEMSILGLAPRFPGREAT